MDQPLIIRESDFIYLKVKILTESEDELIHIKPNQKQMRYFEAQNIKPKSRCRIQMNNDKIEEHIIEAIKLSHGIINMGINFEIINYEKEKGVIILRVPFCFKETVLNSIILYSGVSDDTSRKGFNQSIPFHFHILASSPFLLALNSSRQYEI